MPSLLFVTFLWLLTEERLDGPKVEHISAETEKPVGYADGRGHFERSEYRSYDTIKIMLQRIL
jgi:hypothetical protein